MEHIGVQCLRKGLGPVPHTPAPAISNLYPVT
jgi:hypothetical protein